MDTTPSPDASQSEAAQHADQVDNDASIDRSDNEKAFELQDEQREAAQQ